MMMSLVGVGGARGLHAYVLTISISTLNIGSKHALGHMSIKWTSHVSGEKHAMIAITYATAAVQVDPGAHGMSGVCVSAMVMCYSIDFRSVIIHAQLDQNLV